ncbi:tyrosine-type recombinase/integrase [Patescibacteria group bacterium]|nr:tyrosine-type recombinase/integrase [Patescibacteria group bacterium]
MSTTKISNGVNEYKKYLKSLALAPSTIKSYLWNLEKFLVWLGEEKITEKNLKLYFIYLTRKYQRVNTVNLRLKIVNNYLKFLNKRFQFDLLSDQDAPIKILNNEQLQVFLDKPLTKKGLIALRDKAILEILYYSGLKVGQLCQLRLDQIDQIKKEIIINPKKHILIKPITWFHLDKYINQRLDNNQYLFINFDRSNKSKNEHLSVRSIERLISKYAIGIDPPVIINPQILRNTLAHRLKSEGAESTHIKKALHFETKVAAKNYLKRL